MKRKFVTILGVKIPLENIRSTPLSNSVGGWVSYNFHFQVSAPPTPWKRIMNIEVPE